MFSKNFQKTLVTHQSHWKWRSNTLTSIWWAVKYSSGCILLIFFVLSAKPDEWRVFLICFFCMNNKRSFEFSNLHFNLLCVYLQSETTFRDMISKTYYKYIWLLDLLLTSDPLPYEDICVVCEVDFGSPLPIRTFHEYRSWR